MLLIFGLLFIDFVSIIFGYLLNSIEDGALKVKKMIVQALTNDNYANVHTEAQTMPPVASSPSKLISIPPHMKRADILNKANGNLV